MAQVGQKSTIEGKAKSRPDWVLQRKELRDESLA